MIATDEKIKEILRDELEKSSLNSSVRKIELYNRKDEDGEDFLMINVNLGEDIEGFEEKALPFMKNSVRLILQIDDRYPSIRFDSDED